MEGLIWTDSDYYYQLNITPFGRHLAIKCCLVNSVCYLTHHQKSNFESNRTLLSSTDELQKELADCQQEPSHQDRLLQADCDQFAAIDNRIQEFLRIRAKLLLRNYPAEYSVEKQVSARRFSAVFAVCHQIEPMNAVWCFRL